VLHTRGLLREIIMEIVRLGRLRKDQRVERALCDVLLSELKRAPAMPTAIELPLDRRALAVARAVIDKPAVDTSLEELCAAAGVSVRTLERIYRREIGTDFESWRIQWRLMKAIEMLVAGGTVEAVACAVGYRHPGAFSTLFRKRFGTAPRAWVRALGRL